MPGIRLNPSFSIVQTSTGVLLCSDLRTFQLHGRDARLFVKAIAPLLDGSRDRDAIVDVLRDFSRGSVLALLDRLEEHHILEKSESSGDERWRGQLEFFRSWTGRSEDASARLNQARVLIAGLEPWGVAAAAELAASGIGALGLLDDGRVGQHDLLSVRLWSGRHLGRSRAKALAEVLAAASPWCRVTSYPLRFTPTRDLALDEKDWTLAIGAGDQPRLLQGLARFAHAHGIPSLFGRIEGLEAVVGPAVAPGRTACWNCARLRQLANAEEPAIAHALQEALLVRSHQSRIHTYLAPMAPLVGHLLALEALKIVSGYAPSDLGGRILVQNLVTLETTFHTVIRMPWCEVCGRSSAGGAPPGGPVLGGQRTEAEVPGPRRLDDVKDTGELRGLLAGWIDARTGIISDLMFPPPPAAGPDLPVTCAAVLSSYTEGDYVPREMENASGKGLTRVEAMIGAVGEAIERYSAARCRGTDLRRAPLDELREDTLDPRRLALYEDAQYDRRGFPFARFDAGRPIAWTRGCWLDTGLPVWVPALLAYRNLRVLPEENFCQVTSNGLAAGAGFEDAAMRALLELAERDAFMITWLARRTGRRLLVDDSLDAGAREAIRQLNQRGVDLEIYLLDAGVRIPVVACVGLGDGKRWPGGHVGLGAHLNPLAATRKAVLELGHTGPYISQLMARKHRIPRTPGQVHSIIDHALYYAPASRAGAFAFLRKAAGRPLPLSQLDRPKEVSLAACVRRLREAGLRVAAVDVTSPDVAGSPFRVVRALAPGMQPIDFGVDLRRRACRRLTDRLTDGLNPHPHPLA